MKTITSLFCFLALLASVRACAPLTPGLGHNADETVSRGKKIASLTTEIEETNSIIEEIEQTVATQETKLQKLEAAYRNAVDQIRAKPDSLKHAEIISDYKKKLDDLNKAKTKLNEQRKKRDELEVEKKVLGYGKLSDEAIDEKIVDVTTKLASIQTNLTAAKLNIRKLEVKLEEFKEENALAFRHYAAQREFELPIEQGKLYWELKEQLETIEKSDPKYKAIEEEIADLQKQMTIPDFFGGSKEDFYSRFEHFEQSDEDKQAKNTFEAYEAMRSKVQAAQIEVEKTESSIHTLEFEKTTLEKLKTTKN